MIDKVKIKNITNFVGEDVDKAVSQLRVPLICSRSLPDDTQPYTVTTLIQEI